MGYGARRLLAARERSAAVAAAAVARAGGQGSAAGGGEGRGQQAAGGRQQAARVAGLGNGYRGFGGDIAHRVGCVKRVAGRGGFGEEGFRRRRLR